MSVNASVYWRADLGVIPQAPGIYLLSSLQHRNYMDSEVPCSWHTPYQPSHPFHSLFFLHLFRLYMKPRLTLNSLPTCLSILCAGITGSTILTVLKSFTFPRFQRVKTIEFCGVFVCFAPICNFLWNLSSQVYLLSSDNELHRIINTRNLGIKFNWTWSERIFP